MAHRGAPSSQDALFERSSAAKRRGLRTRAKSFSPSEVFLNVFLKDFNKKIVESSNQSRAEWLCDLSP